mgnify:CR=1 FL=1
MALVENIQRQDLKDMTRAEKFTLKREVEIELEREFHTFEDLKKIYKKFEEIRRPE